MFTIDGYLAPGDGTSAKDVEAALLALSQVPLEAPVVREFSLAPDGHLRLTWGVSREIAFRVDIDLLDDVAAHLGVLASASLRLIDVATEGRMALVQSFAIDESVDDDDIDVGLVTLKLTPLPLDLTGDLERPRFH